MLDSRSLGVRGRNLLYLDLSRALPNQLLSHHLYPEEAEFLMIRHWQP